MPPSAHPAASFDIDQLIAQEDDPKFRVLLVLVKSMGDYLHDNTKAMSDLSSKLDTHLTAFEARAARDDELRNQGRGAWRVLAWVLGIVQVVGLGIWVEAKNDIKGIHEAITLGQQTDKLIEARTASHETRITAIEAVTRTNKR